MRPLIALTIVIVSLFTFGQGVDAQTGDIVALINDYRTANGLNTLVVSPELMASAQFKSDDMALNDYFSHLMFDGRTFSDNVNAFGFPYISWKGEALAAGTSDALSTFNQWVSSPSHNAIMLAPQAVYIGVGYAVGEGTMYTWYWTLHLAGGPTPTEPVPTEPVPTEPVPTETIPTETVPTEPAPTVPVPTEVVPTATEPPVPTQPVYTEPALMQPIEAAPKATPEVTSLPNTGTGPIFFDWWD